MGRWNQCMEATGSACRSREHGDIPGVSEYLKMILSLPRSKSIDEARVLVQKLEDAIRKYEDCVGTDFDDQMKVRRLLDILPVDVEKHMVLESKGKDPNYNEVLSSALGYFRVMATLPPRRWTPWAWTSETYGRARTRLTALTTSMVGPDASGETAETMTKYGAIGDRV